MTQVEKLEALVKRAIDNGYKNPEYRLSQTFKIVTQVNSYETWVRFSLEGEGTFTMNAEAVIFNHDFARALFGEQEILIERPMLVGGSGRTDLLDKVIVWQYHLQQAVISKDPIYYMYQAVFDAKDSTNT